MRDVPIWVWVSLGLGVLGGVALILRAVLRKPPQRVVVASPDFPTLMPFEAGKPGTERLRPRLVNETRRAALGDLPSRRVEALGLHLIYVLDAADSVTFVRHEDANALGLTESGLHAHAMANLQATLRTDRVRAAVGANTPQVIELGDGHDAARLLLVPQCLSEGESVGAVIPDVDTLALGPADEDYAALRRLARSAAGERLYDGVVVVTRAGFRRVA